jgi:hypothetical protein
MSTAVEETPTSDGSAYDRRFGLVYWVVVSIAWVIVARVLFVAHDLRPMSDDYCSAAGSSTGVLSGINTVYQTWGGDLVPIATSVLLVGRPLNVLPIDVASLLPFAVASSLVGIACGSVILLATNRHSATPFPFRNLLGITPIIILGWWSFLWAPIVFGAASDEQIEVSTSVIHWQIINSVYVIPACTVILLLVTLAWRQNRLFPPIASYAFLLAIGVIGGLSSLPIAATLISILLIFAFLNSSLRRGIQRIMRSALHARRRRDRHLIPKSRALIVVSLGVAIGVTISAMAPGTAIRSRALADIRPIGEPSLTAIFHWMAPNSLERAALSLTNPGLFVGLVAGFTVGIALLRTSLYPATSLRLGLIALLLVPTSAVINYGSEAFSYQAYWHYTATSLFLFVASTLFGVGIGNLVALRARPTLRIAAAAICVCLFLVCTLPAQEAISSSIAQRHARWISGPAPLTGIADIEAPYVAQCWKLVPRLDFDRSEVWDGTFK